jgi:hypothetical protein
MSTSSWPPERDNFDWKLTARPLSSSLLTVKKSGDPSLVSLSAGEMQRLIDIEQSAEMALRAMSAIRSPDQCVTDAASALANALARPALGG